MFFVHALLIAFICAAMNHLGLIAAAERVIRHRLPVLNCPKCCAFWAVVVYGILSSAKPMSTVDAVIVILATALLMAWAAMWMELAMGAVDVIYNKVYDTLYPTAGCGANEPLPAERNEYAATDAAPTAYSEVPDVW